MYCYLLEKAMKLYFYSSFKEATMKTPFSYLILILWLVSCEEDHKLTFIASKQMDHACADCTKIELMIPEAQGNSKLVRTINTAVNEEVIRLLTFDDTIIIRNPQDAITSFKKGFSELRKKFEDEAPWEAKISAQVSYEDKERITLSLDSYLFTGGAHGYRALTYLNFDKKQEEELEHWQLFKDVAHFEHFAELKFRIQEGIPQNTAINSTGFMFENGIFHLPKNIGFTAEGLLLLYNPYEVASYADGSVPLLIPYEEVTNYLSRKIEL